MDIMRTLTAQSSHSTHFWTKLRKRQINISLSILMYFWFFVLNLTTKWMSGLLLDSYLPENSLPVVEGIDDLVNNPNIEIMQGKIMQEILDHEGEEKSALANKLMKRLNISAIEEFTRKDELTLEKIDASLNKVLQGQSVILFDSGKVKEILVRYSDKPLWVAKEKYARTFNLFWVNKDLKIKKELLKL